MIKYKEFHEEIRKLRSQGLTYSAINNNLGVNISKSTLAFICRGVVLSPQQINKIQIEQLEQLPGRRQKAVQKNKFLFEQKVASYRLKNLELANFIKNRDAKLLALAVLYLGEGAKWKSHRGLQLGSANPTIIRLYISLLEACYGITRENLRCRIQHRADQDSARLVEYWSQATSVDPRRFYASYVDKRTVGHTTKTKDYHGVCVVSCAGTNVQLELEQIVDIIGEAI